jgi:uroporphyrinogen-III synthase
MRLLVTRPNADATAERLRRLGHHVTCLPLMAFEPLPWQADAPDAVMLTSPQAARCIETLWPVPVYAVGGATAAAARAAGFADVRDGGGTVQALVDKVAADGIGQILHLAGVDRTPVVVPPGLHIDTVIVYRARLLPMAGLPDVDMVLLYSARTAAHFAAECDRLAVARATVGLGVLSVAIATAAGPGWREIVTAAQPTEDALLAAIDTACEKGDRKA